MKWILATITSTVLAVGAAAVAFAVVSSHDSKGGGSAPGHAGGSVHTTTTSPVTYPTATSSTTPAAVGTGYLATGPDEVAFLQWNRYGSEVSGSGQEVVLSGQTPNMTTEANTFSVTGTINGSSITLSFGGSALFGESPAEFGQIGGGRLTINFPQNQGGFAPVTFKAASVDEYNAAVNDLKGQAVQQNDEAIAAAQTAKKEQAIDNDVATVNKDIGSVTQASASTDLNSLASAVSSEQAELTTTAQAAQKVVDEARQYPDGNYGEVCADASGVEADASGVAADAAGVGADAGPVQSDINGIRSGIPGLNSDFAQLQSDQSALLSYSPPAPTQDDVSKAIGIADQTIAASIAQANSAIDTANGYVSKAYDDGATATRAGNCGGAAQAPVPLSHLS